MQSLLEKVWADLTLGDGFGEGTDHAERWLERQGLDPSDAHYLSRQGFERLLTYRRLVRGNLREALERCMPGVVARLGATFDEYFARFLRERGPRSHYLRDVTPEFLEFCVPLWATDERVPAYVIELADHEALQVTIGSLQARPKGHVSEELDLETGVEFIDACRIVHYAHAIHELSHDETDPSSPRRESTWLLVYRSPAHEVRTLKLTALAAAILLRLIELKETLRQAIVVACTERGTALGEEVLTGTATLLADLADRGVLLGKPAYRISEIGE